MKALFFAAVAALNASVAQPVFGWRDGALYQVLAHPGRVTDIALEPGETLSANNPVAAGDTVRWVIGDSESGTGASQQVHILVKPVEAGLVTNLVIGTTRRTYHVELRSTGGHFMSSVAWRYPEGELVALRGGPPPKPSIEPPPLPKAEPAEPDVSRLHFGYRLEGQAPFRPVRVFDDGRRTVIDFPPSLATGDMPPIFVIGRKGEPDLVNYRVVGRRMIVDQLFDAAELRLGAGRRQATVRIRREAAQ
jgi:type IV secretion system protein VirB9